MYHEAGLLQIAWFENDPIKEIKLFPGKNINTNLRKKIHIFHGLTLKQSLPMSLVAWEPERAFRRSRVPHSYWW